MLEGAESSASTLLRSKRTRRENDGGGVGHAKEKDRASREETHKVEGDAVGLDRHRVAVEDATAYADAAAEAGLVQMEEATIKEVTAAEVIASRAGADGITVGEDTATEASSGQASQGEPRETMEEAIEEASAGVGTLESQRQWRELPPTMHLL
jgi:hypothetical protein